MWFSFPAPFILAATGLCLAAPALWRKDWRQTLGLASVGAVWAISFLVLYLVQLRHFRDNPGLAQLWEQGYMPLPPHSLRESAWLLAKYFSSLRNITGNEAFGTVGLAFFVGAVGLMQGQRQRFFLLLGPVAVALLASGLRIYPFDGRLLVYMCVAGLSH